MASNNERRIEIVVGFKDKISAAFKSAGGKISSAAGNIKKEVDSKLGNMKAGGVDKKKFESSLRILRNSALTLAREIGNDLQFGVGVAAAGLGAFVKVGVDGFLEMDSALTDLKLKTGEYGYNFNEISKSAKEVSLEGYGESIKDVTDRTAILYQMTGETGDSLKDLTEQSMIFTQTFSDSSPEEYLGAVQAMSKNLGGTWSDNMNLLLMYRQKNADLKQDLLDTANEYANAFKEAGFSNVGMLDLLNNAAKSGVFNMDKIGDSVQEFGIRLQEGGEDTLKALTNVRAATGDTKTNFEEMFAAGGEQAQEAFKKILIGAMAIKDPITRNNTLVTLIGTKAEEMSQSVINSYASIDNSIQHTNDVTEQAKKGAEEAKKAYEDSASVRFTGLTREFQQIIADSFLTKENVNKFFDYITNNKDTIIESFKLIGQNILIIGTQIAPLIPKVVELAAAIVNFASEHPNITAMGIAIIAMINPIIGLVRFLFRAKEMAGLLINTMGLLKFSILGISLAGIIWGVGWLIKNADEVKYSFIGAWETIKGWSMSLLEFLTPLFEKMMSIKDAVFGLFGGGDKKLSVKTSQSLVSPSSGAGATMQSITGKSMYQTGTQSGGITVMGNVYGGDAGLVELQKKMNTANANLG